MAVSCSSCASMFQRFPPRFATLASVLNGSPFGQFNRPEALSRLTFTRFIAAFTWLDWCSATSTRDKRQRT